MTVLKGRKFHTGKNKDEKCGLLSLADGSASKYWSVSQTLHR